MAKILKSILAHAEETCNAKIFPRSPWKGRPGSAIIFAALLLYFTNLTRSDMFLCGSDGRSELKPKTHLSSLSFLQEIDGLHNGTEDMESESNSTQDVDVESASPARRRPQRLLELPFAEQKGSWIGNQWVPPDGWRHFSAKDMQTLYKDSSVMFIGDSLARRAAATMHGILKEATIAAKTGNASNLNVAVAKIDHTKVINVNKYGITEPCTKWEGKKNQPYFCRTMPGGVGDYVYVRNKHFRDLSQFIKAEVSGESNITENFDIIIIAMGNWDAKKPEQKWRNTILDQLEGAIHWLGKLQSKEKTIIWRTSGFSSRGGNVTNDYFFDVNTNAVDQINSIATLLQQENNTVSNLTCLNWAELVLPRSFGSERINGDTYDHYGLEVRLAFIQMITNHLASRQGLEF
mmetsp:Transcript_9967/g.13146  ORF Transcript_9967/g.13146 Transcript_9967/m.13146 type:complete len:405 (-) Transcript_9967:300-1514(-)|eukprot:CAMPEP_0198144370 /NCGR_PEP_ID=MMETSP1443-20131203/15085_1 /TAXON_ID=186043 /ORGANISM="Entomoneis sp., Strain CCMP2396" /LENGTH=404 /DNA_ID=CAMNT_0043807753 /DNA_START=135 /DNA_END=1349 /DNA_ORIENTATION=+